MPAPGVGRWSTVSAEIELELSVDRDTLPAASNSRQSSVKRLDDSSAIMPAPVCDYGGFSQFSLLSLIQSRPDWPLPGAPAEPQLVSSQLPLVAKLRILSIEFR